MPKLLMRLRFNGATTSRSWIRKVYLLFEKHCELFQWGHNLSVMDTRFIPTPKNDQWLGSFNGATTSRSWIRAAATTELKTAAGFQWGHNLSVMDTRTFVYLIDLTLWAFQWGHNLSVMDTLMHEAHTTWREAFQWGHNLSVMDTAG